jgi:alpha-1,2-mannosyltransferase
VLGFEGLERYPAMLRRLSDLEAEESYSLVGAASALGLGDVEGRLIAAGLGVALLVASVVFARRGDDLRSFTFALAAAIALTPIVWLHYLVLLLVPLAIARPRFSAIWLMPLILWLTPLNGNGEAIQPLLPALVAATVILVALLEPQPEGEPTTVPAVAR